MTDVWAIGDAYEQFMGRWSRRLAVRFLAWLGAGTDGPWVDAGCGTGALTGAVLDAGVARVIGIDPSAAFARTARQRHDTTRARFVVADARAIPLSDRSVGAVVSGLALNFVPAPERALAEFVRIARPGAVVAAYVWDYAEGMQMLRRFWDVAASVDPKAAELDEGLRFPLCRPEPLRRLWTDTGVDRVAVEAIEIPMFFESFAELWQPFLGGQGPAGSWVQSRTDTDREALRRGLSERVGTGPIALTARAWAVRGYA